ncbi:MAG: lipid A biosynthesis acyltransferase [Zoogloeaceae bacterium]|jgi:KDO2-lipid IV(A) lauroyltransferase|nr:lipid A biosynthesis acyltransferase [Zoogloeaceae bacterium]
MKSPARLLTRLWQIAISYPALALLWLIHWLPLPLIRMLGAALGHLLRILSRERRAIARINLALCFPGMDEMARERLLRRHFVVFAQSLLDRSLLWWASRKRLARLIALKGSEHLQCADGCPVLLLAPHFVGLDAGGIAISRLTPVVSIYSRQKNPLFNRMFYAGRMRFNAASILLSRQEGVRRVLKAMRQGLPLYYLPDMDFGRDESIFVPFFGVPAATIPGVSRLARATGAKVLPVIARLTPGGYEVEIMPPRENFPGENMEEDTAFINRFIEERIMTMPEQYYWLHKRFKTRPPGEEKLYPKF